MCMCVKSQSSTGGVGWKLRVCDFKFVGRFKSVGWKLRVCNFKFVGRFKSVGWKSFNPESTVFVSCRMEISKKSQ